MLVPTTSLPTRTIGFAEARRERYKAISLPTQVNSITGSLEESYSEDALFRHMNYALEVERQKVAVYQKDLEASGKKFEIMEESYKATLERQQQTLRFLQKELLVARTQRRFSENEDEGAKYSTLLVTESHAGTKSPTNDYYNPIISSSTASPSSMVRTFASTSNISESIKSSNPASSLASYIHATSPRRSEFEIKEKTRKRLRDRINSLCNSATKPSADEAKSCRIKMWIAETQHDTCFYDSDPFRS